MVEGKGTEIIYICTKLPRKGVPSDGNRLVLLFHNESILDGLCLCTAFRSQGTRIQIMYILYLTSHISDPVNQSPARKNLFFEIQHTINFFHLFYIVWTMHVWLDVTKLFNSIKYQIQKIGITMPETWSGCTIPIGQPDHVLSEPWVGNTIKGPSMSSFREDSILLMARVHEPLHTLC